MERVSLYLIMYSLSVVLGFGKADAFGSLAIAKEAVSPLHYGENVNSDLVNQETTSSPDTSPSSEDQTVPAPADPAALPADMAPAPAAAEAPQMIAAAGAAVALNPVDADLYRRLRGRIHVKSTAVRTLSLDIIRLNEEIGQSGYDSLRNSAAAFTVIDYRPHQDASSDVYIIEQQRNQLAMLVDVERRLKQRRRILLNDLKKARKLQGRKP